MKTNKEVWEEPRKIKRNLIVCNTSDFDGKFLDHIILELQGIKTDNANFFNLRFYETWRNPHDPYGYSVEHVIIGDRMETDSEYEQRIARKKKRKESEGKRKATLLKNKEKELQKLKEQVEKLERSLNASV